MSKETFYNILPIGLIVIGFGLWTKALILDQPTNRQEAKLYDIWTNNLTESNDILVEKNAMVRMSVKEKNLNRPHDQFILDAIDTVMQAQNDAIEQIENIKNPKDSTYIKILNAFHVKVEEVVWSVRKKRPTINEKQIEEVLNQQFIAHQLDKKINNPTFFYNYILISSSVIVDFLSRNTTFSCFGFDLYKPILVFEPTLKVGQQSKGEVFLAHFPNHNYNLKMPERLKINGQWYPVDDGVATVRTIFKDEKPHSFVVESDSIYRSIRYKWSNIEEAIATEEQIFTINPFKQ